ncbi:MAG: phosphoribosylformylglycinamidine cyclo-ligase [Thermoplasmata archaeon]
MEPRLAEKWTYAAAGVNRDAVRTALTALLKQSRYRSPPAHGRPVDLPGHYAGLIRIGREIIAVTTDTVGTKVLLARSTGRWEPVGEDIVAVNVNDLAAVGARPCGLVDVILCDEPDAAIFEAVGRGLARGLRRARCSLLGGETAVVPDIVHGVDLGGTAIGFFPRGRKPITGVRIRPGDVLLGLRSDGFHANGWTLVRRLLEETHADLSLARTGGATSLGEELVQPSRIYTPATEAVAGLSAIHGLAHISGGGVRNLIRLNSRVKFRLDGWPSPEGLFAWIQSLGAIEAEELYQTFNVGIGFVIVLDARGVTEVRRRLSRVGFADARVIGKVERGTGVVLPQAGLEFSSY